MKRWKGLFHKEWILMRWGILIYAAITIFLVMVGPMMMNRIFGIPMDFFDNTSVLAGVWLVFGTFISYGVLISSLGKEIKQRDTWLHSPAPMLQLVGAKAIFAALVTVSMMLLIGVLLGLAFFLSDAVGTISFADGVLAFLSVMIALFLNSIYIMAIGFFFWSLHQVLRSRIGEIAILATLACFFVGVYVWKLIGDTGLFRVAREMVPIKMTETTFFNESTSYFFTGIVQGSVITSLGSLVVYGAIAAVLFVVGATLFEKKVRL